MLLKSCRLAAAVALLSAAAVATANARSASVTLRYVHPLTCTSDFAPNAGGGAVLGQLSVYCNSGRGFDITAALDAPTSGVLSFAGQAVTLSDDARLQLFSSSQPRKISSDVRFTGAGSVGEIVFEIAPRT